MLLANHEHQHRPVRQNQCEVPSVLDSATTNMASIFTEQGQLLLQEQCEQEIQLATQKHVGQQVGNRCTAFSHLKR
jgi:hypothetical protein